MTTRDPPSTIWEIAARMSAWHAKTTDHTVRKLLGRWVSEFEPCAVFRGGTVVGLCVAGDPTTTIVVHASCVPDLFREILHGETPRVSFRPPPLVDGDTA